MIALPKIKKLKSQSLLQTYGHTYFECSGLSVPQSYLQQPGNRVYAIYLNKQMIGGFILGSGASLRTLEVFARPEAASQLKQQMGPAGDFTEITCFWIAPEFRHHTQLNTFIWLALAFCLKRFGNKKILFGTCSAPLARLYGVTEKSVLIHQDEVMGRRTFIFQSNRSESLRGFLEIIRYKLKRSALIRKHRQPLRQTA
jgi:hypothetical protein